MGEEQHHSFTAPNLWFLTPFANHIWCLDHLDGLTHLSCISRLTKMSKTTNTFYILLMTSAGTVARLLTAINPRRGVPSNKPVASDSKDGITLGLRSNISTGPWAEAESYE